HSTHSQIYAHPLVSSIHLLHPLHTHSSPPHTTTLLASTVSTHLFLTHNSQPQLSKHPHIPITSLYYATSTTPIPFQKVLLFGDLTQNSSNHLHQQLTFSQHITFRSLLKTSFDNGTHS